MLTLHLTLLGLTALVILYTDSQGLLWLLGKKETLSAKVMTWLHWAVWAGLLGMILTGISLASSYGTYLMTQYLFGLKMFFVLLLVINAFLIGRHMHLATEKRFSELSTAEKRALIISGAVSTISWIGAFVAAKLLFG